jgi:predicted phosphodiesterase
MKGTMTAPERNLHVVIHDLHFPKWHPPTVRAILDFLKANQRRIKSVGLAGDFFDNEEISHHNASKLLYRVRGAYQKNRIGFNELVLTPLEEAMGKEAERWAILGNHERFETDFIETHPELEGLVSHVDGLEMPQRGWEIIPLGHSKSIGNLNVIHGEVLTGIGNQAGVYPSKKAMELYGSNVLAGHTHAPQSFTKVSPVDHHKKYMAWIAPIAGNTNPGYLRNRPTAWLNGFTIVEMHPNNRDFNLYPVIVTSGRFLFSGKVYGRQAA